VRIGFPKFLLTSFWPKATSFRPNHWMSNQKVLAQWPRLSSTILAGWFFFFSVNLFGWMCFWLKESFSQNSLSTKCFFSRKNLSVEQMVYILPAHCSPSNFLEFLIVIGDSRRWCYVGATDVGACCIGDADIGAALVQFFLELVLLELELFLLEITRYIYVITIMNHNNNHN